LTDTAPPEVILIGDSHARALKEGCDALGIPVGILSVSGNFWHMGRVAFDPERGIRIRGNRGLANQSERIRERLGGRPVLNPDVPVIVSAGFNLGRLVPKLTSLRHLTSAEDFEAKPDTLFLSDDFLRAYVAHQRNPQLRILRRLARHAPVTVVPPPLKLGSPAMRAVYTVICDMMRAVRLDLYEPLVDLAEPGQGLDSSYFGPDGIHGNERYGTTVIEKLIERGALGQKAA
jgi:hypothetical protein